MNSSGRILVFRIGALGDTLLAIPALYAIRRHYGESTHICLLRDDSGAKLVVPDNLLHPHSCVNSFMAYTAGSGRFLRLIGLYGFMRKVHEGQFDTVIYLAPSQRSILAVWRDWILFRLCGIRHTVGFFAFPKRHLFPKDTDGRAASVNSESDFLLNRLKSAGIKTDALPYGLELTNSERDAARNWLLVHGWVPDRQLVAIAPGSKQLVNHWPIERFSALGRALAALEGCQLVVIGGPSEYDAGEQLVALWGTGINAAGIGSARSSAALIEQCQLLVGLDTGTTHLAAAVGTRCVALYSSREHPGRWEPLGHGHVIIRKDQDVPCAGCMLLNCPKPTCLCMDAITVEEVIDQVRRALYQLRVQDAEHR